jgi:site-specific recombinase XerD
MAMWVVADPPEAYARWAEAQRAEAPVPSDTTAQQGQRPFQQHCAACHTVRGTGAGGILGPDLTHLMSRETIGAGLLPNTPGNLSAWIVDAPSLKPGTRMPATMLSGPELRAVAAYLARFKGQSRVHTESDLRSFVTWCEERGLDPLAAQRPHIELYVRWMQEVRRYKPSTISRRVAVVAGFYRTCVIDELLAHSPAEYVRRPNVPPESPTLGLTHLQFEAMLATARQSSNINDFALVAMLGLLGLRIFEACGANIEDLGEEHGHRVLKVHGKGGKVVLTPLPPAVSRAIERAVAERESGPILRTRRGTRMDRHCATRRLHRLAQAGGVHAARMHPHMLRHTFVTTMLDAGVDLRDVQIAARHADPRTTMRYDRARKNLDRHPNYILAAYMASGT